MLNSLELQDGFIMIKVAIAPNWAFNQVLNREVNIR